MQPQYTRPLYKENFSSLVSRGLSPFFSLFATVTGAVKGLAKSILSDLVLSQIAFAIVEALSFKTLADFFKTLFLNLVSVINCLVARGAFLIACAIPFETFLALAKNLLTKELAFSSEIVGSVFVVPRLFNTSETSLSASLLSPSSFFSDLSSCGFS